MRFEITRVSIMDIEGIEDEREASEFMAALSVNTEGQSMLFQQRPITYVRHVKTEAQGQLGGVAPCEALPKSATSSRISRGRSGRISMTPQALQQLVMKWREKAHAQRLWALQRKLGSKTAGHGAGAAFAYDNCAADLDALLRASRAPAQEKATANYPCGCERRYCPTHVPAYLAPRDADAPPGMDRHLKESADRFRALTVPVPLNDLEKLPNPDYGLAKGDAEDAPPLDPQEQRVCLDCGGHFSCGAGSPLMTCSDCQILARRILASARQEATPTPETEKEQEDLARRRTL